MQLHGIPITPSNKHGRPAHGQAHHAAAHRAATPHRAASRYAHPRPGGHRPTADERHEQLVRQTQKWVAQTFFGQLLKQMRDSPFKSKLFDGGRGGEAFQEMADQRTADSMASGTGHKLVDSIVSRIERSGGGGHGVPARAASVVTGRDWGHA